MRLHEVVQSGKDSLCVQEDAAQSCGKKRSTTSTTLSTAVPDARDSGCTQKPPAGKCTTSSCKAAWSSSEREASEAMGWEGS